MARTTCKGTRDDGSECESPIVGSDGYCPAHRPEGREKLREAARKGGQATARRFSGDGLEDADLPPLDSPQAAERWLEAVGRAVAVGKLGHNQGRTVVRAVREFLRAHDKGQVSETLSDLLDALATWKRTGDKGPVLEVIEGRGG